jgi:Ca2+-binding EF-hand superfamily protein
VGETLGAAAIAALPAEQKALYQSMSEAEKAVFAAMSAEERAAFAAMSPEERAKLMRQQGVVGPPLSAAALAALPDDQKRLYENMSDAERAAFASMSEEERMRYASMTAEQRAAYMRDTMGVEDLPGLVKLTPEQRALYQNMSPAERAAYEAMTAEQRAAYDKMSPADRAAYASMSEAQRKAFVANRKGGGKGGATGGQSGGGRGGKAWSAQKEEEDAAAKAAALLDNLDFSKIRAALPAGDDEESAYKRKAMFAQWDLNGNGALGCNEVATALRKLMDGVITDFMQSKNYGWANSWQHVLRKAFSHAKAANSEWLPAAKKRHDDFVEMDEFQLLLGYLLRYFELYVAFARMDTNRDQRVDRVEFQAALPRLAQWGISLSEDEAEDEWLALTGGRAKHVLFNQFINWALERNLMYS